MNFDRADERSWQLRFDYAFKEKVDGLHFMARYVSGDDITRPLLLQIIAEQEQSAGQPILTEVLLAQLQRPGNGGANIPSESGG